MSTGEFVQLNKENEHILVCLSSSPSNEKIIRTAAKMARDMRHVLRHCMYRQEKEKENRTKEDWKLMYNLQRNLVRKS